MKAKSYEMNSKSVSMVRNGWESEKNKGDYMTELAFSYRMRN